MDYEKKYKGALAWVESIYPELNHEHQMEAEAFFPELRESEDERIRKELIEHIKANKEEDYVLFKKFSPDDVIAWLEKLKVFTEHGDGLYHFGNSEFTYVGNPTWDNVSFLEKQGEQKSFDYENATIVQKDFAPKGEPRFNIGDWIVSDKTYINNDYRLCKVVGISDGCYTIQTINGWKGYNTFKEWESDYHLWSIEDAKEGDVLVASDESLFIFARTKDIAAYYHYSLCKNGSQEISDGKHAWEVAKGCHPATKEQHDLLFKKIHEAGYEWNADKKELKKIENHANWSEEDEDMIQALNACIDAVIKSGMNYISFDSKSILIGKVKNWLKSLRPQNY